MRVEIGRYLRRHHWGMLAMFVALGGTGYAFSGARESTIHACVANASGRVRISERCNRHEHSLTWNQIGPRGAMGPVGPVGPTDGYYSTKNGSGTSSLQLPPGNYIASGGCTAYQPQTTSQSSTNPVFGQAESALSDNPLALLPGPWGGTGVIYETSASVPNMGNTGSPATPLQTGSASLSTSGGFSLPQGGTIYELCEATEGYRGFGGSAAPVSIGSTYITAIRVGALHQL